MATTRDRATTRAHAPEGRVSAAPPRWVGTRARLAPPMVFAAATGLLAAFVVVNEIVADGSARERAIGGLVAVVAAAHVSVRFRRIGDVGRGALEILVGSIAVAATIGMRVYVVGKTGPEPVDLVALPALVTGAAVLVQGTALLLRPVRRRRRVFAIPVGLALIYYFIWPVAVGLMITHLPQIELGSRTPADLGFAYEDVSMRTDDGVLLSAWYLPSEGGAAVALFHGAGSTRTNVLDHAAFLHEAGYGTLLVDSRGFGLSGGTAMGAGWYGDLDVGAAVTYLVERPDVDPGRIGVLGLSMGGEEVLAAAASDDRIRAVVAEGAGAIRTLGDMGSIPGVNRVLGIPHYWVQLFTADLFTDAPRPVALVDAVANIAPRPVLLISAGELELQYTEAYLAAAPETTELWRLMDAPHVGGLATHPDGYRSRVLALFAGALGA